MGFSWDYTLLVSSDFINKIENLTDIKQIFEDYEFSLRSSVTSSIKVYSQGDLHEFKSEETCFEFLSKFGGMVQFWRTSVIEVGVGIYPQGYPFKHFAQPSTSEITIYVDNTYFRNQDNDSKKFAKSIEGSIYIELARISNPIYGFMVREDSNIIISDNIQKPTLSVITFLNQSSSILPSIQLINHLIHNKVILESGQILFFGEYPWTTEERLLESVNDDLYRE